METSSPFSFLNNLASSFTKLAGKVQPPTWVVDELHQRLVLLLNHVLMQEPEAMARLARVQGQVIRAHWRQYSLGLVATPAGLLDRASPNAKADLNLRLTDESGKHLLKDLLAGNKPALSIDGDVELAAVINWLGENVRWDVEEDIARIVGIAPAHAFVSLLTQVGNVLRNFVVTKMPDSASSRNGKTT